MYEKYDLETVDHFSAAYRAGCGSCGPLCVPPDLGLTSKYGLSQVFHNHGLNEQVNKNRVFALEPFATAKFCTAGADNCSTKMVKFHSTHGRIKGVAKAPPLDQRAL